MFLWEWAATYLVPGGLLRPKKKHDACTIIHPYGETKKNCKWMTKCQKQHNVGQLSYTLI